MADILTRGSVEVGDIYIVLNPVGREGTEMIATKVTSVGINGFNYKATGDEREEIYYFEAMDQSTGILVKKEDSSLLRGILGSEGFCRSLDAL